MAARKQTTAKKATKKTTKPTKKKTGKPSAAKATKKPVTIDRRGKTDRRKDADRRKKSEPISVDHRQVERRVKVNRRRQIDPTTCERDYNTEEIEFMSAMDQYKRTSGRMFPTCSEVLEVIKSLGYIKVTEQEPQADANEPSEAEQQQKEHNLPTAMPGFEMSNNVVPTTTMI